MKKRQRKNKSIPLTKTLKLANSLWARDLFKLLQVAEYDPNDPKPKDFLIDTIKKHAISAFQMLENPSSSKLSENEVEAIFNIYDAWKNCPYLGIEFSGLRKVKKQFKHLRRQLENAEIIFSDSNSRSLNQLLKATDIINKSYSEYTETQSSESSTGNKNAHTTTSEEDEADDFITFEETVPSFEDFAKDFEKPKFLTEEEIAELNKSSEKTELDNDSSSDAETSSGNISPGSSFIESSNRNPSPTFFKQNDSRKVDQNTTLEEKEGKDNDHEEKTGVQKK